MGRDLGELGTPKDALDVTFSYFGQEIRVDPNLSEMVVVDFMEAAQALELPDDGDLSKATPEMQAAALKALPMVKGFLRETVHPDDFAALWTAAKSNRQGIQDLLGLANLLIEKVADRPTGRRAGSSATPRRTHRKSEVSSSVRVQRRFEKQGRPDLALIVADAAQAPFPVSA